MPEKTYQALVERVKRKIGSPTAQSKLCGVMLMDLCNHHNELLGLLGEQQSDEKRERNEKLMATLDKLNCEHGKNTVRLGMPRKANAWELRCEHRTPRYTTRWDELAVAKL